MGEGGGALTWALLARAWARRGKWTAALSFQRQRWEVVGGGGGHIYQGGALAYPSVPT